MNKIVLFAFIVFFAIFMSVDCQTTCQKSADYGTGECCGTGFRGDLTCTKIRAKGDICWRYGTRDYPTCAELSHNCVHGLTCLPKNDPQDPNAYECK